MNPAPYWPNPSLYVGDLPNDCTESDLIKKFSVAGHILSVKVCRDVRTGRSLGYAYVNFEQLAAAQWALDTMNFNVIKGHPIRIMWSQRDPSLRKSGLGNIFIKNLEKSFNHKALYDTFRKFGYILSGKVAQDEKGNSRGYGFVHFRTEEAANKAIQEVNGSLLNDKKVFVGRFISRKEKATFFTNVFVKNFAEELDDDKLLKLFQPYGKVLSHIVMRYDDGKSKGFGFVAFEDPKSAEKCCKELNNQEINGKCIFVGRAQKRNERQTELKKKFKMRKIELIKRSQNANLYIKNLDDTIDDEKLKNEFAPYGTITSAKVMTEDGRSKGFGFVCFSSPEEAQKALTNMNGRYCVSKPLGVAMAQRKEDRKRHLASKYKPRPDVVRMQHMSQMFQPAYIMPIMSQPAQRFYTSQMAQIRVS